MEQKLDTIEKELQKKLLLYQELVECLNRERECLINIDMEKLWHISMEKRALVADIHIVHKSLLEHFFDIIPEFRIDKKDAWFSQISPYIPYGDRERFKNVYHSLMRLKAETKMRSRENIRIIEDSIGVLDEIISIIAKTGKSEVTYNSECCLNRNTRDNILLHREA